MPATSPVGPQVRIRALREANGLTIPALRDRIAEQGQVVTASHLNNIELGYKAPSARLLAAWCLALGLTPLEGWRGQTRSEIAAATDSEVA